MIITPAISMFLVLFTSVFYFGVSVVCSLQPIVTPMGLVKNIDFVKSQYSSEQPWYWLLKQKKYFTLCLFSRVQHFSPCWINAAIPKLLWMRVVNVQPWFTENTCLRQDIDKIFCKKLCCSASTMLYQVSYGASLLHLKSDALSWLCDANIKNVFIYK